MESFSDGQPVNEETLSELIKGTGIGVSAMPGSPLTDRDMAALIAYLREATR